MIFNSIVVTAFSSDRDSLDRHDRRQTQNRVRRDTIEPDDRSHCHLTRDNCRWVNASFAEIRPCESNVSRETNEDEARTHQCKPTDEQMHHLIESDDRLEEGDKQCLKRHVLHRDILSRATGTSVATVMRIVERIVHLI